MYGHTPGVRTNLNAMPLRKYELSILEEVSLKVDEATLAAFDGFFTFERSQIKRLEVQELYVYEAWEIGNSGQYTRYGSLELEFMVRYPNVENISIRDLADETDMYGEEGMCPTLYRLFFLKTSSLKRLKEIQFFTPKYADSLIEDIKRNIINRSYVVTACPENADYGAHLVFPLSE